LLTLKNSALYEGEVAGYAAGGDAVVRITDVDNDTHEVLVDPRQAAPGDTVLVRSLRPKTGEARIIEHHTLSPKRRLPRCPHFGTCGGCSLQHLAYADQLVAKTGMVQRALGVGEVSTGPLPPLPALLPTIGCSNEWHYRNKLEYTASTRAWLTAEHKEQLEEQTADAACEPFNPGSLPATDSGALGFFVPFSGNKVLNLSVCYLQPEPSQALQQWVGSYCRAHGYTFYDSRVHDGQIRTLLVRTSGSGQSLVMPIFAHIGQARIDAFMTDLVAAFPLVHSVWYCVNTKRNDTYADLSPVHVSGSPWMTENLDGLEFRVGPLSFMQVNPTQTPVLYHRVLELAELKPEDTVWDLYCGAGTISAFAARKVKAVLGIEYVEQAVTHARTMASENQLSNVRFIAGDMKDILTTEFTDLESKPDVIITDPPRAGMHPSVTKLLCKLRPRVLVYVSCKPESLARDLAILGTAYRVEQIQPIDLMPQTVHVETIVKLVLLEP